MAIETEVKVHTTSPHAGHDEWLTPPWIIAACGPFDLDPCAPVPEKRPWNTATEHYCIRDNGLLKSWHGRVWLNPPYGDKTERWLSRMAAHKNGIALVFARTDTVAWQRCIFPHALAILFLRGRLTFYTVAGVKGKTNAGAPSALIAYSVYDAGRLASLAQNGALVYLNNAAEESPHVRHQEQQGLVRQAGTGDQHDSLV